MLNFYKSTAGCGRNEHIDVVQFPNGKFLEFGMWSNEPDFGLIMVGDYTDGQNYLTKCSREEFLKTAKIGSDALCVLEELAKGYIQ